MVFSKKKSLHFDFILKFLILFPKSRCSLKKKVFTSISSSISLFYSQNQGVFKKKKKSFHFDFILHFLILFPKSRCFQEKKKKLSLRFHPPFSYFIPKIKVFFKKKVFTSISSSIFLFYSQNQGVL